MPASTVLDLRRLRRGRRDGRKTRFVHVLFFKPTCDEERSLINVSQILRANVILSGASRATVDLDGRLDASVSGGSHLLYTGEPTLDAINTSGGFTVERKEDKSARKLAFLDR